ncbi:MAG: Orotidine 5'-phosphate decarboxylase [Chlamydiae bacterium]|nr:Orotidine 5'-phosphate decarboxylase [Chlamydiota bacterium]
MTKTNALMNYDERAQLCQNPTAKKLLSIMAEKKTNLAVNADVTTAEELLHFADLVGPHICVLKTHIDILVDFNQQFISTLKQLAEKHRFLLFEDRKFADIGAIAKMQYQHGIYEIASWADITNAHPLPGPGVIQGLKEVGLPLGRGALLVAEMSSSGSLATGSYTEAAITMAKQHSDFVFGFISQRKLTDDPRFIHFCPGVKLAKGTDSLGQQYNTPEKVLVENGCDIIIVGRGIIQAPNPQQEAARYQEAGMQAFLKKT